MTDKPDIERAKRVADEIRTIWPEKAAEIERAIAAAEGGKRDNLTVNVGVKFRLEKFAGDYTPGATPIEVIEGEG